jgi:hypothetical protein
MGAGGIKGESWSRAERVSRRISDPSRSEVGTALGVVVTAVVAWLLRRPHHASERSPFADAPWDDEPITDEDKAAILGAMEDPEPSIPWEQVKAEARRSA